MPKGGPTSHIYFSQRLRLHYVAWGDRDFLLLSRQAKRAQRVLPWARHVTLPGCGHVPFSDDPEAVAQTILAGARNAQAAAPAGAA